jgi:bifunctional non-homologous end joining protein LigD
LPSAVEPALGRLIEKPPVGDDWLHEIKFDGYRLLAWLDHGKVTLRTRHGHDWTGRFPEFASAIQRLPANLALLDGEVTALAADGASSFGALQQALNCDR